jgi:glutamate-1-semialdehyde 2,1-aminomutase
LGGAQAYFGVTPDLAVYSKACANGMPISLLTGKKEIMQLFEKDIFFYTTFGGEALSLAACIATIKEIEEKNVPAFLDKQGQKLKDGYNQIAKESGVDAFTKCTGYNCRTIITFDAAGGDPLVLKSFVQQEMIKRGVLWAGFHNMSFSHTDEDVEYTLSAYKEVLPLLKEVIDSKEALSFLKGEPVEAVFRKVSGFNMKPMK